MSSLLGLLLCNLQVPCILLLLLLDFEHEFLTHDLLPFDNVFGILVSEHLCLC